ncbi:MAG: UDP-N-acetylmuramoyl-tripeptide--D-alanyl-D-alanine ligase [Xylophilus ampelinus]
MTLGQAADWIAAAGIPARRVGDGALPLARIHTDTRSLRAGDGFVALRGERFDANGFLADARARGAVAAVAHGGLEAAGLAGVEVPDSRAALLALAAGWRAQFGLPLIAVTGSNGKTTVTQMLAAILRAQHGEAAFATRGNLNNDVGVPLTLLRLRARHAAGVVELGMNHPGEIEVLARCARPTVALVNNAQREHQEFMHTVEAVARENGAVFASLPADGAAVFPADDAFAPLWRGLAGARRCLTFSAAPDAAAQAGADVRLLSADWRGDRWAVRAALPDGGAIDFPLAVAGRHNLHNALAATAAALAAGTAPAAIAAGLGGFEPVAGRSRAAALDVGGRRITLVDDSYNANPDSVDAAIAVLAGLPPPRLLVLGDMAEVGAQGPEFHAEAGRAARARGIERVHTLGPQAAGIARAFGAGARHFEGIDGLCDATLEALPEVGSVLVKGSRSMRMERIVQAVEAAAGLAPAGSGGH